MPDYYSVPATLSAVGAALKTIGAIVQPATVRTRPILTRLKIGYNGTPADNAFIAELRRLTSVGTLAITSVTPEPKDPAALASWLIGGTAATGENATVEGTAGNIAIEYPQAQRATILEVFDMQDGWRFGSTAGNGMLTRTLHASYTGAASSTVEWLE